MSVRWKNRMISLWAILLLLMTGSVLGALDASLDRQVISETETVELTLAFEGQSSSRPDTSPLESDFDILASSGSNQLTITNGRTSARTLWTLVLSPKRQGELEIPPLEIDGQLSQRLTLKVDPASAVAVDEQADVFIESELLTESPYVQAQLLLKVKLFHAVDISQGTLSEPTAAQTLVQRLGKDRQFISYRGERRYQVFERLYALLENEPVDIAIEDGTWTFIKNGRVLGTTSGTKTRLDLQISVGDSDNVEISRKHETLKGDLVTVTGKDPDALLDRARHWLNLN